MDISKCTVPGFARFYRSVLRHFNRINNGDALKLTYKMYAAVIETYRFKKPHGDVKELSETEFCERIKRSDVKPYRTEIQLYRAMEAVLCSIDVKIINIGYVKAALDLSLMMGESELRFYKAFDMEIDDERTVYRLCARSVIPRADEPGLCLLKDWLDAVSASA